MPESLDIGLLLFAGVLAWASVVDVRHRIIPNAAVVAGAAVWCVSVALGAFASAGSIVMSIVEGLAVSAFALACSLLLDRFTGASSLGGGDVKLLFPIGLFVGVEAGLATLGLACVFAAVYCAARSFMKSPISTFPFAPFLSLAFLCVIMLER